MRLVFAHRADRYRPEGSAFSSPLVWSCREIEGFLIRAWQVILSGCGGTSTLPEEQRSPRAGYRIASRSAISQSGLSLRTLRGGVDPGGHHIRPQRVRAGHVWKDFSSGDGNLSSPGCTDSMYDPQPIIERPVEVGFPHPALRFSTPGITVSVPRLSEW